MMKRILLALALVSPALADPKLSPDAQAKLDAAGMVIVDKPLSQGFSAYIGAQKPVFITSDSLLMAYHRIFEEMVGEMEIGELLHYRQIWPQLWKNLPAAPEPEADDAVKEGHRRARLLVATAHHLLIGSAPEGLNPEEMALVTEEVRRVESGAGSAPPPWILANPGLDELVSYPAFIPSGPYEGNEIMSRYYRFRKWLQEMQLSFRDESTSSLLACLGLSIVGMEQEDAGFRESPILFGDFEAGILDKLAEHCSSWWVDDSIPEKRDELRAEFGDRPRWRLANTLIPAGSKITRAILSSSPGRVSETPLAIGKALGNSVASAGCDLQLPHDGEDGDFLLNGSWELIAIRHYFEALRTLNAAPDDRVPPIVRSEPWQRKQLNATLGSWAEYRYALGLAAREEVHFFGAFELEPGFVEPIPAFYRHLGESAEGLLSMRTRFSSGDATRATWVLRLEALARLLRQLEKEGCQDNAPRRHAEFALKPLTRILYKLFPAPEGKFYGFPLVRVEDAKACGSWAETIETFARSWWANDPEAIQSLAQALPETPDILGPRLARLAGVCFRLEAMAERQLAGRPWSEMDESFLNGYGSSLGWLMFYEGSSYFTPRDDAPRIARYATLSDPQGAVSVHHAAIARPRLFYIRYPNRDGKEILCQGSVYAFRNVAAPATPSRQEWFTESEKSPWPAWSAPIVGAHVAAESD